jgi:HipA-like C-terminal domain
MFTVQTPNLRIQPKMQSTMIDVASWEKDPDDVVFPQGARAKGTVVAPQSAMLESSDLVAQKLYMFKRSKKSYPDQFWGEVIAYRIGCLMGLEVPHTFAAWNSETQLCGALSEWFYVVGRQLHVHGGDLLKNAYPAFDRKVGEMHNLLDIEACFKEISQDAYLDLKTNWQQWWFDALVFDALIGNTDRHQDNWGFILQENVQQTRLNTWLTPLFDNGTSLGHERFTQRVQSWKDVDFERYIQKGTHHVKWSLTETPPIDGHFDLISRAAVQWPQTVALSRNRLNFSPDELCNCFEDLLQLNCPVPLTGDRIRFIQRLLRARLNRLIHTLDDCLGA